MKLYWIGIFALTGLVQAAGSAGAADATASLFGVPVGQPLSVPKCEIFNSKLGYSKPVQGDSLCSYPKPSKSATDQYFDIYFPKNGQPDFVPGMFDKFDATIRDGIVEKLRTFTTGLTSQDEILKLLTDKYGKPTAIIRHEAQNLMGAKFQTIEAHWAVGTDLVNFIGAMAVDGGMIEVITGEQSSRDHQELTQPKGPPL